MKLLRVEKKACFCLCLGCLTALAVLLAACTQDPIFAMIAREVEPREPRIKGVPSRMVIFNYKGSGNALFVGGSSLHRYKNGAWDQQDFPQPPGGIIDLAATQNYLYALVDADSPKLYRLGQGAGSWAHIPFNETEYPRLDSIYGETDSEGKPVSGAGLDYLFVGSRGSTNSTDTGNYAVFYIAGGGGFREIKRGTSFLTGAVVDGDISGSEYHYFSTSGDGIYYSSGGVTSFTRIPGTENKRVSGMIPISDISSPPAKIVALCHDGDVLSVAGGGVTKLNTNSPGYDFTGPLAVWKESGGTDRLLLAAVKTTSTTYGYREIPLYAGPLFSSTAGSVTVQMPGTGTTANSSTMDDSKHYQDTVEPKPVNAIFQVPDDVDFDRPLFASIQGRGTAKDNTDGGLWSYRWRDGSWQWNAE